MANSFLGNFNPDALLAISTGLLTGRNPQEQLGNALTGFAQQRQDARVKNRTLEMLQGKSPELAQAIEAGIVSPGEGYKLYAAEQSERRKAQLPNRKFQTLPDGTFGWSDESAGTWTPLGTAAKKADLPAIGEEYEYAKSKGFEGTFMDYQAAKRERSGANADPYAARKAAAEANGLEPDNPAYQSFILTGKMPREDQSPLTATDKKAIIEADDLVAANENAITALKRAQEINSQVNQGFGASARAAIGNSLPDIMVPDFVSSPESSAATADYDNLVIGQALQSLKATFGAAPTEGERKILMEIQGSASLPADVRAGILKRGQELAERRLEFNRQRAEGLRGGTFYKPTVGGQGSSVDDLLKKYGG